MRSTLDDLKNRRSIRSFKPEQIKKEDLDAILEAGTYAASGGGAQPAIIVVVQDKAVIAEIDAIKAEATNGKPAEKPFNDCVTLAIVLVDTGPSARTPLEDGCLVMGNMLNAAYAVGVGSCWLHRAKETFDSPKGKALLEKWGITGAYQGVGFCSLGYPEGEHPQAKPRKDNYIYRV